MKTTATSTARLVLYTITVLIGALLVLPSRHEVILGVLLLSFSPIILMRKRPREQPFSIRLTKWQIVGIVVPVALLLCALVYFSVAAPSSTRLELSGVLIDNAFVIALRISLLFGYMFAIGLLWWRWSIADQ